MLVYCFVCIPIVSLCDNIICYFTVVLQPATQQTVQQVTILLYDLTAFNVIGEKKKKNLSVELYTLFLFTAAIYLAKRNIRKKGVLELHEQVRSRDPSSAHAPASFPPSFFHPTEEPSCVFRSSTTACTSG